MSVTLTCIPQSLCSWNYRVVGLDAAMMVDFDFFSEQGRIDFHTQQQRTLDIVKPTMLVGHWLLKLEDTVIAEAHKLSLFAKTIEIRAGGRNFVLTPKSVLGRSFLLKAGEARIGVLAPVHPFTRRAECRFNDEISVDVMAFAFWLSALMWRRQQNKSS